MPCYLCISLAHSVLHLLITLLCLSCLHLLAPHPRFLFSPLPYCAAAPCLRRNHRGSCLFTLFLGIKAVAITRCQLYGTPKTLPAHCLCLPFPRRFQWPRPYRFQHWGIRAVKGRWPRGDQQSPIKRDAAHMELC